MSLNFNLERYFQISHRITSVSVVKDSCLHHSLRFAFFTFSRERNAKHWKCFTHKFIRTHYRNESTLIFMLIPKCINYECYENFDRVCDRKTFDYHWNKYSLMQTHLSVCATPSQSVRNVYAIEFHHISKCWLMRCFLYARSHMYAQSHTRTPYCRRMDFRCGQWKSWTFRNTISINFLYGHKK